MSSHDAGSSPIRIRGDSADPKDTKILSSMLNRLKSGDESAATEILERYESQVRLVVRRFLPRVLRSRFDSLDIMQSVWRSFFQKVREDEAAKSGAKSTDESPKSQDFTDSAQLFAFLSRMARNKVIDQYRRETSQKSAVQRQRTMYGESGEDIDPPAPDESPAEVVEAADELSHWRSLVPEDRQELIDMKADGLSTREIGVKLGISERTVQRVLEDLRQRVERRRFGQNDAFPPN
jgi:RNA polymerase sigma-70 factor (ECF subfamily)